MADENIDDDLPVSAQLQNNRKAPNPLVPVIIMLVAMPAIIFAVMYFVVIPMHPNYKIAKTDAEKVALAQDKHSASSEEEKFEAVAFEQVTANIGNAPGRFVRVTFTVEGRDEEFRQIVQAHEARIVDAVLSKLGALTIHDIDQPGLKDLVKDDLVSSINRKLPKPVVEELYFSEFITQ